MYSDGMTSVQCTAADGEELTPLSSVKVAGLDPVCCCSCWDELLATLLPGGQGMDGPGGPTLPY